MSLKSAFLFRPLLDPLSLLSDCHEASNFPMPNAPAMVFTLPQTHREMWTWHWSPSRDTLK